MGYLKTIANEYIVSLHIVDDDGNIDKAEFDALEALFQERPEAPDGHAYLLRADNLEWELVELPPEGDIDDSEAINILLGGDGT